MGREDERPILHGLSGGRWVGAVARVRTKLWFPAPRAELGREEGGFGCSHRPGLTSALEATAQSEQDLLGGGGGGEQSTLRGSKKVLRTELLVGTV